MSKTGTLCAMCGDIGFQDQLFQCSRCIFRFQHSYCTNYYDEKTHETVNVCDWCLTEERNNKKPAMNQTKKTVSSEKIKQTGGVRVKTSSGSSSASSASASVSSKPAGRRYKLLKDVLC